MVFSGHVHLSVPPFSSCLARRSLDFFCLTFIELLDFFLKNCLDFSNLKSFMCRYFDFYLETLTCDLFGSLNHPTHVGFLISAGESCLGAEHSFLSPSAATLQGPFHSQSLQSTCSLLLSSSLSLFFFIRYFEVIPYFVSTHSQD